MENKGNWSSWAAIMLGVFGAYYAYVFSFNPLSSSRPAPEGGQPRAALVGEQFMPSRLWQDPLDATRQFEKLEAEGRTLNLEGWRIPLPVSKTDLSLEERLHPSSLRQQVRSADGATNKQVVFLPVLVEGYSYQEDVEVRRRLRYAVQQALATSGFRPADRDNLGVVKVPWPSDPEEMAKYDTIFSAADGITNCHRAAYLPYEWFEPDYSHGGNPVRVLVMWLPEEHFADDPVWRMMYLVDSVFGAEPRSKTNPTETPEAVWNDRYFRELAIIGPRSSDTLKRALETLPIFSNALTGPLSGFTGPVRWLSCQATAPDGLLLPESRTTNAGLISRAEVAGFVSRQAPRVKFTNLIDTDDVLARQMVDELIWRRNVRLEKESVVLVGESDTAYGRSLLRTFEAAFEAQGQWTNQIVHWTNCLPTLSSPAQQWAAYSDKWTNFSSNLYYSHNASWPRSQLTRRYTYLRGLDGEKASPAGIPKTESKGGPGGEGDSPGNRPAAKDTEVSEGQNQMDYARRLAAQIADHSRNNERAGHGRVEAVGILGSDAHDKLILLQALRGEMPQVIFFTTDLDARLFDSVNLTHTRNLLVASAYPLKAEGTQTPFRDVYQTSIYRAVKAALAPYASRQAVVTADPKAKEYLYEIGLNGPVRLPVHPVVTAAPSSWWRKRTLVWGIWLACVFFVLGTFRGFGRGHLKMADRLIGWLTGLPRDKSYAPVPPTASSSDPRAAQQKRIEDLEKAHRRKRRKTMWRRLRLAGLALLGLFVLAFYDARRGGGEPFDLLDWFTGVSVWPTTFIRLATTFLSCAMVMWTWWAFVTRRRKVWWEYHLPPDGWLSKPRGSEPGTSGSTRWHRLAGWWRHRKEASITLRLNVDIHCEAGRCRQTENDLICAAKIFRGYMRLGTWRNRMRRVVPLALVLFGMCFLLIVGLDGLPKAPVRGDLAWWCEKLTLFASIGSFLFLLSYMIDVTRLTEWIIHQLGRGKTHWPDELNTKWSKQTGLDPTQLRGYLDVKYIAEHTAHVNLLIWWPMVILFLMGISRSQFFDHWPWPLGLRLVFGISVAVALICAWFVRQGAREVRDDAVTDLKHLKLFHIRDEAVCGRIQAVVDELEQTRSGAYANWFQDPSYIGVLIPAGGTGLFALLKLLLGY